MQIIGNDPKYKGRKIRMLGLNGSEEKFEFSLSLGDVFDAGSPICEISFIIWRSCRGYGGNADGVVVKDTDGGPDYRVPTSCIPDLMKNATADGSTMMGYTVYKSKVSVRNREGGLYLRGVVEE